MNGFITDALRNWFFAWPWYAQVTLAISAGLIVWGALEGLYRLASRVGGWKAGAGALLGFAALVAALWPRKRDTDPFPHPDGEPQHPRVVKKAEKKGRETIFRRAGEDIPSWLDRMTKQK